MHSGVSAKPVLAAWGHPTEGKPVFVGLALAADEDSDAWDGFPTDLCERGPRCPLLVVSDGAPRPIGPVERKVPAACGNASSTAHA